MDVGSTSQTLQASNILNKVYATSVILKGESSLPEMQAAVGNNYGKLQFVLKNYLNTLKKLVNNKKMSARPKQ